MPARINTERISELLRQRAIDLAGRRILVTNFRGSTQESDLTEPLNCDGYGRIRHFRRREHTRWPSDPLPIDPAIRALGLDEEDQIRTQAFQNAACNWRCWYCFVDFPLLTANQNRASFKTAAELVCMYLAQENRPLVIDLTGGQPDLVPEWIPWMMAELRARGLSESTYLWSDDNLSTDYFWRYLSAREIELISGYRNYGKVCCFKGFDSESFMFNTRASGEAFDQQFDLARRLVQLGIDLYFYATFTTNDIQGVKGKMSAFVDRLQNIHPMIPLRTVPLKIQAYAPTRLRMRVIPEDALGNQQRAVEAWGEELEARYSTDERAMNICDIMV